MKNHTNNKTSRLACIKKSTRLIAIWTIPVGVFYFSNRLYHPNGNDIRFAVDCGQFFFEAENRAYAAGKRSFIENFECAGKFRGRIGRFLDFKRMRLAVALNDEVEEDVYAVRDALDEGTYADAEAAVAAKAELYATYPDYLQIKGDKGTNVDLGRDEFTFEITTTGVNPSIELNGLYEALEKDEVILAFDYTAAQDLEGGYFYYETPNLLTDVKEEIPTLPTTEEWTTVYYNVSKGIKQLNFGAADHGIFWGICKATKEDSFVLEARNFRFMTKAQMQAEGGKALNGEDGDLNGDGKVDIADAVTVLNIMAADQYVAEADLNGDQKIDIADFVTVLNIMAAQ